MIETLLSLLIIGIIAAGTYYAAYRFIDIRHNRDQLADELKRAESHIKELEEQVEHLLYERSAQDELKRSLKTEDNIGWSAFEARR